MRDLSYDQEEKRAERINNRRMKVGFFWLVSCLSTVWIQPYLKLNEELVDVFLDKGTWVAGLLIVGISGVNAMYAYMSRRDNNANT